MRSKGLAAFALLLISATAVTAAAAQAAADRPAGAADSAVGQTARPAAAVPKAPATVPKAAVPKPAAPSGTGAASPASAGEGQQACESGPCDDTPAHISIATPAPAPPVWPWQDRIAWVANVLLVVLGYVGISVAISTLKKIHQQAHYAETAAQAAADTAKAATEAAATATEAAKAALGQLQAMVRAERPWVLVTVEPSRKTENRFTIMATNRGRGPARILSSVDKMITEVEESRLAETPELVDAKANASLVSVILLPGESTGIGSFGRDEVKDFCENDEKLRRVENWEEMILLYGKIVYQDLMAADEEQQHETFWCYWYIHGRKNSGMVAAGPVGYHRHT